MVQLKGAGVICWNGTERKRLHVVTNMSDDEMRQALATVAIVNAVNDNEQIALVESNYRRLTAYRHFYNHNLTEGLLNTHVKSRRAVSNL